MNQSSKPVFKLSLGLVAAFGLLSASVAMADESGSQAMDAPFCDAALDAAEVQLKGYLEAYPDPTNLARSYENGKVKMVPTRDWTSGFVAGSFWYMYEHSDSELWLNAAKTWTAALESQKNNTRTHDVGFIMYNSYGNGLRLTQDASYIPILIETADSLTSRYNPTVGAIRSWDHGTWSYPVIIDNMMNLELLYFASNTSGDPKYAEIATQHANTTLKNHFRSDSSSYHVVDYDPETGKVLAKKTHQGIADDSAWARGQAWGLYGYTMAYRFTRNEAYLERAKKIAEFYLTHPNMPEDLVPVFDFNAPDNPDIVNTRDSSAAAVTASGLQELAGYVDETTANHYRAAAMKMLRSLASPAYAAKDGDNAHFLLMHGTGRWQADDEVDAPLNYGDYYYLEALMRCSDGVN